MKKILISIFVLILLSNIALAMNSTNYTGSIGISYISSNASSSLNNTLRIGGNAINTKSDSTNYHQRISILENNFIDIYPPEIDADLVNLSLTQNADGSISLNWNNDTNYDITKYNIYRSNQTITVPLNTSLKIASNITALSWIDITIEANTNYYYVITAVDNVGNENLSAISYNQNLTVFSACQNAYGSWASKTCAREKTRTCYISSSDIDIISESQPCGGGGGGGGSTNTTVLKEAVTIVDIKTGETKELLFTNPLLIITKITPTFALDTDSYKLSLEKISQLPSNIPIFNEEFTYINLQISSSKTNEYIKSAEINFKIDKKWLVNKNQEKINLRLYRFTNSWQELETKISGEDNDYIYYTAITPGFSYFKVALKDVKTQTTDNNIITGNVIEPVKEEQKIVDSKSVINNTINDVTTKKDDNSTIIFGFIMIVIIISAILFSIYHNRSSNQVVIYKAPQLSKEELMISKLTEFLLKNHEDYKDHALLKKSLISKGWNAQVVEKAVNNLPKHSEIEQKAFEMAEYIKDHHVDSIDHKKLKHELIHKGWNKELVNDVIKDIEEK